MSIIHQIFIIKEKQIQKIATNNQTHNYIKIISIVLFKKANNDVILYNITNY